MLHGEVTVECQISDAAIDELGGVKGTESIARQAQFLALRDAVERIASDIFDKGPVYKGLVVRIFTKHVRAETSPDETAAGLPHARPFQVITAISPQDPDAPLSAQSQERPSTATRWRAFIPSTDARQSGNLRARTCRGKRHDGQASQDRS